MTEQTTNTKRLFLPVICFAIFAMSQVATARQDDAQLPDSVQALIGLKSRLLDELRANPTWVDKQKVPILERIVQIERRAIGLLQTGNSDSLKELVDKPEDALHIFRRDTISNSVYLAELYEAEGRYNEAVTTLEHALETAQQEFGKHHWETGDVERSLSDARWLVQATAEQVAKRTTVDQLRMQGLTENKNQEWTNSLESFRKANELLTELGLTRTTSCADNLMNIADTLAAMGNSEQVEQAYFEAIQTNELVRGKTHPANGQAEFSLGIYYRSQSNLMEALARLEKASEIYKQSNGEQSLPLARTMVIRGLVLKELQQYDRATDMYVSAFKMLNELGERNSELTLQILNAQYELYMETEALANASIVAGVAADISRDVNSEPNFLHANWLVRKGSAERALGNHQQALEQLGAARQILERLPDFEKHETYISCLDNQAMAMMGLGQLDEAERNSRRATDLARTLAGENSLFYAVRAQNAAVVLIQQNKRKDAEAVFAAIFPVLEKELGAEHPQFLQILNDRATNCLQDGQIEQAIALWTRLNQIEEKLLGSDNPSLQTTLFNLKDAYTKKGDASSVKSTEQKIKALQAHNGTPAKAGPG
jgi:tetratricopeptide (TPR) repeat protein